jgi:hypothetical protein
MKAQRSNGHATKKIDVIFSRQDEGLGREEREARLKGLERIANSVHELQCLLADGLFPPPPCEPARSRRPK